MSAEYDYRIIYTITRAPIDSDDWEEIGFGSSCSWGSVNAAAFDVDSQVQSRDWQTDPGMPEPSDVDLKADR